MVFDVNQNDQEVSIAVIYAPNTDTPEFYQSISSELRSRHEHKIVIGDFNLTLNSELDRQNTFCNNNRSRDEVLNIMDEFYLHDLWRERNEQKREFSWIKKNSFPIKASRLDMALVSGGLDQKTEMIDYVSSIYTDHRGVYMVVELNPDDRGVGYWKFNCTLLQNKEFVSQMNKELEQTINASKTKQPCERWEIIKERIKKTAIKFSKKTKSQNDLVISQLSEKINQYQSNLPLNQEDSKLMDDSISELEERTLQRVQGIMFRSKAKWYEEGEKSTKYFLSLEKTKYNSKTCYKMLQDDGTEITTQDQILKMQKEFYQNLYSVDKEVNFNMPNTYGVYVPEEIKMQQCQQITVEELQEAIKNMNNNKTPGEDGIPVDFYKVFWSRIKEVFVNMMLECFERNLLHKSARRGILNLIPKANKDSRFIKNLRPITLLNTDYKIIEKAIANKMIPALTHIIHTDQRGFMKNRRISVNIRKMIDIIHQANKQDLEAVILSLDFVKCFDKCSFSILHGSLDFF